LCVVVHGHSRCTLQIVGRDYRIQRNVGVPGQLCGLFRFYDPAFAADVTDQLRIRVIARWGFHARPYCGTLNKTDTKFVYGQKKRGRELVQ
jgi:hypothetical protein